MRLTEAENRTALAAAIARGAKVHGLLDSHSSQILHEERQKVLDARNPIPKLDPVVEPVSVTGPAGGEDIGTPSTGGGS